MDSIEKQFRAKIREVAYTPFQVVEMIRDMGFSSYVGRSEDHIRKYAKNNGFIEDIERLGIKLSGRVKSRCWIRKSRLVELARGIGIQTVTEKDFENSAYRLNYQL